MKEFIHTYLELHPVAQVLIVLCVALTVALLKGRMLDRRIEAGDFSAVLGEWGWGKFSKLARDYSVGGYLRIARDVAAIFKMVTDKEALTLELFRLFGGMLTHVLKTKSGRDFVQARLADADKLPPLPEDGLAKIIQPVT